MRTEGKVQVVVKSRKVPIDEVCYTEPVYSASGFLVSSTVRRVLLYGTTLDEEYQKAIDEGRKVSQSLGLNLEVVDAARRGVVGRILSILGFHTPGRPIVVVAPLTAEAYVCITENLTPIL